MTIDDFIQAKEQVQHLKEELEATKTTLTNLQTTQKFLLWFIPITISITVPSIQTIIGIFTKN